MPADRGGVFALLGARELVLCGLDGMGAVAIRAQPAGHQMNGRTRAVLWEVCVAMGCISHQMPGWWDWVLLSSVPFMLLWVAIAESPCSSALL